MNLTSRSSLAETLRQRRQKLAQRVDFPVLLWSGGSSARNFPANTYPYRASSHFLYFAGLPLPHVAIRLDAGRLDLFMDNPTAADRLWHGAAAPREEIAAQIGADRVFALADLSRYAAGAATVAVQHPATHQQQSQILNRPIWSARQLLQSQAQQPWPEDQPEAADWQLLQAIAQLRLVQDAGAIAEIRQAAAVTVQAHKTGMAATRNAPREATVRAAMEQVIQAHNMIPAYNSIVTVQGEVLHNHHYHHPLQPGDLLLADVGAEAESGWASDVTRTWPVSGQFSPTQRDIYEVVLSAHDACIQQAAPGIEYRDLHLLAARAIAAGLVDLGILRGQPDDLVDSDAHALFFPHGIGHLLGLDVHDMEDLGDLAGYAPGRQRSDRFGLCYLRLHRPLQTGMVVTIEPGFYQVPALLEQPEHREKYREQVNWDRLSQFSDVRGIRVENDVLLTEQGCEVLTADLPTGIAAIETLLQASTNPS